MEFLELLGSTGIVGGAFALIGVATGFLLQRWSQRWGKIRWQVHVVDTQMWRRIISAEQLAEEQLIYGDIVYADEEPIDSLEEIADLQRLKATHTFYLLCFNEKDRPTGLSSLSLVFVDENGKERILHPTASQDAELNLPSKAWAKTKFHDVFYGPSASQPLQSKRIEVRANYPNGKQYRAKAKAIGNEESKLPGT